MDVQTLAPSPQMNTPARGDRVARTRDAIVDPAAGLHYTAPIFPRIFSTSRKAEQRTTSLGEKSRYALPEMPQ